MFHIWYHLSVSEGPQVRFRLLISHMVAWLIPSMIGLLGMNWQICCLTWSSKSAVWTNVWWHRWHFKFDDIWQRRICSLTLEILRKPRRMHTLLAWSCDWQAMEKGHAKSDDDPPHEAWDDALSRRRGRLFTPLFSILSQLYLRFRSSDASSWPKDESTRHIIIGFGLRSSESTTWRWQAMVPTSFIPLWNAYNNKSNCSSELELS